MTSTRFFNSIEFDELKGHATKRSGKSLKGEILWLIKQNELGLHIAPRVIRYNEHEYVMTLFNKTTLFDWIVNNDPDKNLVKFFFNQIYDVIYSNKNTCAYDLSSSAEYMYLEKILNRLDDLDVSGLISKDDYFKLKEFTIDTYDEIKKFLENENSFNLFHGDLHLGNILYDPDIKKFNVIDARWNYGPTEGTGDRLYDSGKLLQCVYANYGYILNKVSINQERNEGWLNLIENELRERLGAAGLVLAKKVSIILLFSCAPLHKEDSSRVKSFIKKSVELC